jgi:hypothetical protein
VRLRSRLTFLLISKAYLQMYARTGVATDSARRGKANLWGRLFAKRVIPLMKAEPMPHLQAPTAPSLASGD